MIKNRKQLQKRMAAVAQWLAKNNPVLYNKILPPTQFRHTKKECMADASKFKSRYEWQLKSPNINKSAYSNGWAEECCAHMPKNLKLKKFICLDNGKIYENISKCAKQVNIPRRCINNALLGRQKTAGGFRWAYCDEKGNVIK